MAGIVHVVDDNPGVRDSLCLLLGACGFAARGYAGAQEFLAATPQGIGCVVTDINMPGIDGLELQRRVRASGMELPVIVMTGNADIDKAVRAMKNGAIDFLEKPLDETALIDAITRALGESARWHEARVAVAEAKARLASLTRRQAEVFALLVEGLSSKAIALRLGGSPRTVEVHRARVMEKLAARNLADLVRLALTTSGQPA